MALELLAAEIVTPDWQTMTGRVALGGALGALVGLEREWDGQDAGFRTHLLVALGAALFAAVSVGGFDAYLALRSSTNVSVDLSRIAAYVAPGIGFIGGGAILKYGGQVTGITTAASLWAVAAIGVTAGLGAWQLAAATTLLALASLEVLQPLSNAIARRARARDPGLAIRIARTADTGAVTRVVHEHTDEVRSLTIGWGPGGDGRVTVRFWNRSGRAGVDQLVERLTAVEGVLGVDLEQ